MRNWIFYLFFIFPLYSHQWLHLYFTGYNPFYVDENKNFFKYYNLYYLNERNYNSFAKESDIFFLLFQDQEIQEENFELSEKQRMIGEYIEVLEKLNFDYINFIQSYLLEEKYKKNIKNIINKNNKKIICMDCEEKNNDIFASFEILKIQNLKIIISYLRNCESSKEILKKLLKLHQDTNIWLFLSNQENCEVEKLTSSYMIFFLNEDTNFFYKEENRFYAKTKRNYLFKISLKIREATILGIEQKYIKIL